MNKINRTKFRAWILTALCAAAITANCYAAPEGTVSPVPSGETMIGMPNPMLSYDSIAAMQEVLGFSPMTLPESEYSCTNRYIISKKLADLRYTALYTENPVQLCVRSARQEEFPHVPDISGVYSVTWWPHFISRTNVFIAKSAPASYAARWSNATYVFSLTADGLNETEFKSLVRNLVLTAEDDFIQSALH